MSSGEGIAAMQKLDRVSDRYDHEIFKVSDLANATGRSKNSYREVSTEFIDRQMGKEARLGQRQLTNLL